MENEKVATELECKDKKECCHHHSPLKFLFAAIIGLIIMGGFFCLGRISTQREIGMRQFSTNMPVVQGSEQFAGRGMMGRGRMMRGGIGRGVSGSITAVNESTITIKDSTGTSYTVNISSTTSLSTDTAVAKQSDLKVGQNVIVRGATDSNGQITAANIRIQS